MPPRIATVFQHVFSLKIDYPDAEQGIPMKTNMLELIIGSLSLFTKTNTF